jgi:hypothetical protein
MLFCRIFHDCNKHPIQVLDLLLLMLPDLKFHYQNLLQYKPYMACVFHLMKH